MSDIVAFIRTQLAVERKVAKEAKPGPWFVRKNDLIGGWCVLTEDAPPSSLAGRDSYVADFTGELAAAHIARQDPAATLRRVEALERIVERHDRPHTCADGTPSIGRVQPGGSMSDEKWLYVDDEWHDDDQPCDTLRLIASMWADGDGYDPAWAVE
jgi:hypothetical protein